MLLICAILTACLYIVQTFILLVDIDKEYELPVVTEIRCKACYEIPGVVYFNNYFVERRQLPVIKLNSHYLSHKLHCNVIDEAPVTNSFTNIYHSDYETTTNSAS